MIKNVVFDLGNVLLGYSPLEYVCSKIPDKEKANHIYKEIFLSEEWPMLDRGVIAENDAIERMVARNSKDDADLIRLCMNNWYDILTPIEGTIEILKSIKSKQYNTYILSNFHRNAYQQVTNRYDFFQHFDGGVISYEENSLKPEVEIYNKLVARYSLNPSETLFIDDMRVNIDGASKLGFETILFTNSTELRKELVGKGILGV